jgi:septal ring factor EnvC (AmiA/AmiB activator)
MTYSTDPDQTQHLFMTPPFEGAGPEIDAFMSVPARSRRGLRVVIVLLSLALLVAAGGFAYSTRSAQSWRDTAGRTANTLKSTQQQREDFRAQLAATQVQLDSTKKDLAGVTTQYNQAADRIRSLADEKAQVGDRAAILAETIALSRTVTQELDTCVNNLQALQGYLVNYQAYDSTSLNRYATDINGSCDSARSDNAALAKQLGAG